MKNKLAVLMAERGLKIADLYKDTGISSIAHTVGGNCKRR